MQYKIKKIIISYLNNSTFTGCALAFSHLKKNAFKDIEIIKGRIDKSKQSPDVEKTFLFDVASLTKPLVTVLSILALIKEEKIHFDDHITTLLPFEIPDDKKNITLKQLINHRSGLPSHREFYKNLNSIDKKLKREALIKIILNEKLENKPGNKYIYSDLDYMLLGFIIELHSGETLDRYWIEKIAVPLKIENNFYCFDEQKTPNSDSFVKTGNCSWSGISLAGVVHDDNCRAFGRMMGHAGLFSDLEGIVTLCKSILLSSFLNKEHPSFRNKDLHYLLGQNDKENVISGFDIPTGENPSSGKYFSVNTIGHLGYTGTSFWIDLNNKIIVIVLTNRVIYGNNMDKIREMRPYIHNEIMKYALH